MNFIIHTFKNLFSPKKVEVGDRVSYKTIIGREEGVVKDLHGSNARVVVEDSYSTFSQWIKMTRLTIIS